MGLAESLENFLGESTGREYGAKYMMACMRLHMAAKDINVGCYHSLAWQKGFKFLTRPCPFILLS